ncbi:MAG: hypothetical protein ACRDJV_05075 [Actinomycetota bacterium]
MATSAATTQSRADQPGSYGILIVAGLIVLAGFVAVTLVAVQKASYDAWATLFVTPVLIVVSLPAFARQAAREGNKKLFWWLLAALILKLIAGTFLRYFNTVEINGGTDSNKYHNAAMGYWEDFRAFDFDQRPLDLTGTNFIRFIAGIVYAVVGPSRAAGFVVFSWFAFWGAYYFYRAFVIAVPEGRSRTYARFVFLLPSVLFWPSSLGKEAWMMMGLGITAYGVALLLTGSTFRGAVAVGLGAWSAAFVRPYMPALMIIGVAFAFVLRRRKEHLSQFAPISKAVAMAALVLASLMFVGKSEQFLNDRTVDTSEGVDSTADEITRRSSQGGSEFVPTVIRSPAEFPVGAFTVVYRPLLIEVHTSRALLAGLESGFLLVLTLIRIPWIIAAFRSFRRQPYVVFAAVYSALFIVGFSAVANFGLLVRQRSLLMPVFLVFLAIPPPKRKQRDDQRREPDRVLSAAGSNF